MSSVPLYQDVEKPSFEEGLSSVASVLKKSKRILVLSGAGVSVSCGIPDFRSKNGLYKTLEAQKLGLSCPEDLFDYDVFCQNPRPFYKFCKTLYLDREPSCSHHFLALLENKRKLLRVYTQNMDALEEKAGVSARRMVYAHGSLAWATCLRCNHKVKAEKLSSDIQSGTVPTCKQSEQQRCISTSTKSTRNNTRKRLRSDSQCGGVLKPDITFFGQTLTDDVCKSLETDRHKVDALVVIGTSLSVAPMSKVISYLPPEVPRILINRTMVHPPPTNDHRDGYVFDAALLGFCDDVTRALVKKMFPSESSSPHTAIKGQLLASLRTQDELYQEWQHVTEARERVFLFPGADSQSADTNVWQYQEVAHCDQCQSVITGSIYKCSQCFDYDLCGSCFPLYKKRHAKGQHKFFAEQSGDLKVTT